MLKRFSVTPVISHKLFTTLTAVVYVICWAIILGISFWGNHKDAVDLESVYEKEASFLYVFSSNSKSMMLGGLGGILSFGLISTYLFLYNAISLGKITNALLIGNMPQMALRMLPHAVFELIALAITTVFPIILDVYLIRKTKPIICREASVKQTLVSVLMFIVKNVVLIEGILFIAGIIESLVS